MGDITFKAEGNRTLFSCGCKIEIAGEIFLMRPCSETCKVYKYVMKQCREQGTPISTMVAERPLIKEKDEDLFDRSRIKDLRRSAVFLILGNAGFVRSLEDPGDSEHLILWSQIMTAKEAKKPFIILWMKGTSEPDKTKLRKILKEMEILKEHQCEEDKPTREDMIIVLNALKP